MKRMKTELFTNLFPKYIMPGIKNMLVLGSGKLKYELTIPHKRMLAVDWADKELYQANKKAIVLKCDINNICDILLDKSFDVVVMFDALEHLEKKDALLLLQRLEAKVIHQIIIFVPIDDKPVDPKLHALQRERKRNNLPMGYHLSNWSPLELEKLGFKGVYFPDYHKEKELGAVFCVKNLETGK